VIRHKLVAIVGSGALAVALAACGSSNSSNDNSGTGSGASGTITLGTTDPVTAVDPAGSYDFGSWNIQWNIFETLMVIPPNGTDPVPDAASCTQDDPKTITCKLRAGDTFSNGDPLTSEDVKFSLQRNIQIADPNGASSLLGSISNGDDKKPDLAPGAVETPDPQTVVFHLNGPDLTFMKVLTTPAASIVDHKVYPADKLLPDDQSVGSGPYTLSKFDKKTGWAYVANDKYSGDRKPKTQTILVSFFSDPSALKTAVATGQLDIAWRTLSPTDITSLEQNGNVEVVRGKGSEFRYWVWDFRTADGKQLAVRQAVAQLIDRDAIAKNAYDGTVTPSYSIVPPGFGGQKDSFKSMYGAPSVDKAKQILSKAGVQTPVPIKLGYTPSHYGPNAVDEAQELADELNNSGLFKATTDDAEWEQYQTLYKQDAYDLFMLGWYPDFLDADNYLTPFLRDGGFYANGYKSAKVDKLLTQELGETNQSKRDQIIGQLQDITAHDVPIIPSWNGGNIAITAKGVQGVQETLDPTYIFRFWLISKS